MKLRLALGSTVALSLVSAIAGAQQPYPQQPAQPQPYPQQTQPAPQPYPPQPQPYPQQAQPYPQQPQQQPYPQQGQPYPQQPQQQPYPQQGQPYPQQPQQQPYPQQGQPYPQQPQQQPYPQQAPQYPPQQYQPQPLPPPQQPPVPQQPAPATPGSQTRGGGEMVFLYGTSIAYGIGTGVWIDALGGVKDPGVAIIAPIGFGAAMPVGVYFLDQNVTLHAGTPAAISTGMILGAFEGMAISGTQWQFTHERSHDWSFGAYSTLTFIGATGGAFGGYAFGEWAHLDPKGLAFTASGAGWGAISGTLLGAGIENGPDWKDGGSIAGLIGFNGGLVATGAISQVYTPSWYTQKWMWLGYLIGTAGGSVIYPFYLLDPNAKQDIHHGLIANSLGGVAGVALAGALTSGVLDNAEKSVINDLPFQLGVAPQRGGATLQAAGAF
jgi:hypothetical protein